MSVRSLLALIDRLSALAGAHRRDRARRQLESRLAFETGLRRLTLALSVAPPERIGDALQMEILPLASDLRIDRMWCWTFVADPDWDSAALRAGAAVSFSTTTALPPSLRAACHDAGFGDSGSAVAAPLLRDGATFGAVFCVSHTHDGSVGAIDTLQTVACTVAALLQQKRAERELEHGEQLKGDILASLAPHVAVLDRDGTIIAVNDAWTEFARANGAATSSVGPGMSYAAACAAGARGGCDGTTEALALVERACRGESGGSPIEYACGAPGHDRWFIMTAQPLRRPEGGAVVTHHDITKGKLNEVALRESEDRFREAERVVSDVNRRLILAQEDERRHIARELHDHLSQQLALLALDLQQLTAVSVSSPGEVSETVATALRRTAEIASDVHAMSHRLHPSKLAALGLVATMRGHCRDMSRQNLHVTFFDRGVPATLPPDADVCLFRVFEEALANVVRHSGATAAQVSLIGQRGYLTLRILDDGCGFDKRGASSTGIGLVSMRERLKALHGKVTIASVVGGGTLVEARLPCPAAVSAALKVTGNRTAGGSHPARHAESA